MTIDPVVMAAQAVLGYQAFVSRSVDLQAAAVVSVGSIVAERVNPSLRLLLGEDKVPADFLAVMGSEDLQEAFKPLGDVPDFFILIGIAPVEMFRQARAKGRPSTFSNYNPDFFVDLAAIPIGVRINVVTGLTVLAGDG